MISAIVLAAGLSTRMETGYKLQLPLKDDTIIAAVVKNIIAASVEEVIVVTGYNSIEIQNLLQHLPVTLIYNEEFEKGITTSIKKGVSIAKGNGYMICLGDMPFITTGEYLQLTSVFEEQRQINEACICVAEYENKKGNPVIFSSFYRDIISAHTYMEGCKGIIQNHKDNVYTVRINSNSILKDIDTREDYMEAVT